MFTAYALAMSLTAIDYFQTKSILDSNGRFREGNPVISARNVDAYFAGVAVLNTSFYLRGDNEAKYILYFVAGAQAKAVANNYAIGVRFDL